MITLCCSNCGRAFERHYGISRKRAARPQYCSEVCQLSAWRQKSLERVRIRHAQRVKAGAAHECWEWTGRKDPNGYGRLDARLNANVRTMPLLAHRLAYTFHCGPITDEQVVCHSCDNPPCCNPAHLFIGTPADNNADMDAKGRRAFPPVRRGEASNKSRLTASQVLEIRKAEGTLRALGEKYGVSGTAIAYIKKGRNWAHVAEHNDA